jgi:hypothetical protein
MSKSQMLSCYMMRPLDAPNLVTLELLLQAVAGDAALSPRPLPALPMLEHPAECSDESASAKRCAH